MDQINIMFSDSNQYFSNAKILQTDVGFVNPLDIDIYVKRSFSCVHNNVTIAWWNIQTFNKDHMIDERFVCYQIALVSGQPFLKTEWIVKFNLENKWFFTMNLIQNLLQWVPLITILVLAILTFLLPAWIAKVIRYVTLIWILITLVYYVWKILKIFINTLRSKGIDYGGVTVNYEKDEDISNINEEYVKILKDLWTDLDVQKIALYNWQFYLKQLIGKKTFFNMIKNIFITQVSNDYDTDQLIQDTVSFLLTTSFIWSYK